MSDGTGSAQFGVDSGNWDKDINQLVFMKFGIAPSGKAEGTSFWKLQDSTETDHVVGSGMFIGAEAASSSGPGTFSATNSAAASHFSDRSGTASRQDTAHSTDSPEHELFERLMPARMFRSAARVDSTGSGSAASMLEPRIRNSSATEFRSSSGTDVQVQPALFNSQPCILLTAFNQGRMSMTSVSERLSTGSYATVDSVASTSSSSSVSDSTLQSPPDASGGKKQPLVDADRRRRRGPNYKPLDELRLFGKVMSTAIQSVAPDAVKSRLPHYFRKGNVFAVANGAHRFVPFSRILFTATYTARRLSRASPPWSRSLQHQGYRRTRNIRCYSPACL
jgi:hypothetical protein